LNEKSLKLNPNLIEIWIAKAHILRESGNLNKAIATFDKGMKANPDSSKLLEYKGFTLDSFQEKAIEAKCSAARIVIIIPTLNECEAVGKRRCKT